MHFTDRRIHILLHGIFNSRVVSGDLHTKQRALAAGFKAYYPTEYATITWSDYAIQVYIIIIVRCCVDV